MRTSSAGDALSFPDAMASCRQGWPLTVLIVSREGAPQRVAPVPNRRISSQETSFKTRQVQANPFLDDVSGNDVTILAEDKFHETVI